MACKVTEEAGFDVKVIKDYPPELNCTICTLIIKKAMYGCLKHSFCHSCLTKHIELGIRNEGNVLCPGGCGQKINPSDLQPNYFADRMINTLTTKCSNESCTWQGDLLDLVQDHQKNCGFMKVACQNNGCKDFFLKKDLSRHGEVCLYKLIQCEYCQNDIIKIYKNKHELTCISLSEKIQCEYNAIGCKVSFCRKDARLHEINYQAQHMRLIYKNCQLASCEKEVPKSNLEVSMISQDNKELKEKCEEIKKKTNEKIRKLEEELIEVKHQNIKLKEELKSFYPSSEHAVSNIVVDKSSMAMQNRRMNIINEKLYNLPFLMKQCSLINNDRVVYVTGYNCFGIAELSKSYESMQFNYVISHLDLDHHKIFLNEILHEVKYHLYEFIHPNYHNMYYCFPIDLKNMADFDISIANKFNISMFNGEILIELNSAKRMNLYFRGCQIEIKSGLKFNLQQDEAIFHLCSLEHWKDSCLSTGYKCYASRFRSGETIQEVGGIIREIREKGITYQNNLCFGNKYAAILIIM